MRAMVLGAAALAASATAASPAAAERWSDPGFHAAANVTVHRGAPRNAAPPSGGPWHGTPGKKWDGEDGKHDRWRHRWPYPDYPYVGGYYGGAWALYNNRSFEPSSYNDWWHDRPDRSFPRWMQNNQACERQYWTGAGWRC